MSQGEKAGLNGGEQAEGEGRGIGDMCQLKALFRVS